VRHELERHDGTVEKFIGDAVVAHFGAPVAHEDDPERAVRAAIANPFLRAEAYLPRCAALLVAAS
jgi:class 3 adenylate cyclase